MVKTVVVDIDGTVADISHRLKFVENRPKDWKKFFSEEQMLLDKPIKNNLAIVADLGLSFNICFCTGRDESLRGITSDFLTHYLDEEYNGGDGFLYKLLMRETGDKRADDIIKPELLEKAGLTPENVLVILEDRDRNVIKFRELGYNVFQVANGDF